MDITGEYFIPVGRAKVWAALNDTEILKAAIPHCDRITRISDTHLEAAVSAKIGPVKATFTGMIILSDIDPGNAYTISAEGKGGFAGFAKGAAKVRLTDAPGGTTLHYDAAAALGGKLAKIGQRLIAAKAKKLSDEFFTRFVALAGGSPVPNA